MRLPVVAEAFSVNLASGDTSGLGGHRVLRASGNGSTGYSEFPAVVVSGRHGQAGRLRSSARRRFWALPWLQAVGVDRPGGLSYLGSVGLHRIAALGVLCLLRAQTFSTWSLAKSSHFEVYSQAGAETARPAALWLEQLRAFFLQQTGLKLEDMAPVRVIGFRSVKEYEPFRLRAPSDAYYVGTESRDYIVLPSLGAGEFGVAAHEYAHSLLRASGLDLPAWLGEGLAEFFSTVRIGERGSGIGGDLPARSQILRQRTWIPLAQLLAMASESRAGETRDRAAIFYAESWALADMLMFAPEYGPRFPSLIAALLSGQAGVRALPAVCGRSLDLIARDLRAWTDGRGFHAMPLGGVATGGVKLEVSAVSTFASRCLMAELLLAIGELDRAETMYRELDREAPRDAGAPAALGTIALKRGDHDGARREWKRAIERGVGDAALCYRYATLASAAGLPAEEVRRAYERTIALQPDHDDARYALALLEKNAGEYEAALAHFRGMRNVAAPRAFHYWCAVADALTQLGRREEAVAAARRASERAGNAAGRAYAAQLAYMAQTETAARFVRDANGRNQLVMTRVPHNTQDWNPFIEPADDVRRAQGTLREIDCSGEATRFLVDTAGGSVALAIPDLSRLQARNAPAELTCGPQPASPVTVVYAAGAVGKADGVLRGIEFR